MKFKITSLLPVLILFIFLIPPLLPLFHQGMFVSDDGGWMIVRLSDFHQSLKDGQFPVRWGARLDHEYGYPVFNFLYPGVLYLGEIIHLTGFNFTDSIKILFGLGMFASGFFSYLWLKTKFKTFPAFIGSLVYLYAPYHLFDLYKRGSLGEIVALGLIPTVFYFLEKNNSLLIGLSVCLLILSHNTLALLFLPIIILYIFINKKNLKNNFISLTLGILISSFFFIPALYDRQFTIFDSITVSNWREYFIIAKNFYLLGWGSTIIIAVSILKLFLLFRHCERSEAISKNKTLFFLVLTFLSIFLASPFSSFLWQILPLPKLVQFPWRFLALSILGISYLSAWLTAHSGKIYILTGGFLVIIFFLSSLSYLSDLKFLSVPDSYFSTNEDTTTVKKEYTPIWVKNQPLDRPKEKIVWNGKGEDIKIIIKKSNQYKIQINSKNNGLLQINTHYFPGWYAKIDNRNININFNNPDGIMKFNIPKGNHELNVFWRETPIRLISDIISLMAFFGLVLFSINNQKLHNLSLRGSPPTGGRRGNL